MYAALSVAYLLHMRRADMSDNSVITDDGGCGNGGGCVQVYFQDILLSVFTGIKTGLAARATSCQSIGTSCCYCRS